MSNTSAWSGVDPQSTTLTVDGKSVTPQINSAEGFEYTPETRLAEGVHSVSAQVHDRAGNPAQTGPWSFSVETDGALSLGVTKYYYLGAERGAHLHLGKTLKVSNGGFQCDVLLSFTGYFEAKSPSVNL